MTKSGVVLSIDKNKAVLLTKSGEFVKVKTKGGSPKVGEPFTGEQSTEFHFLKYPVVAASIILFLLIGSGTYAYYSPTASVIIEINPSIKLSVNRWDKIIDSAALNKDGEKVLGEITLKNKNLNDGLKYIVDEAKKDDFINDDYISEGKIISVYVTSFNHKDINLSSFQNYVSENNINLRVNADGKEIPNPIVPGKGKTVDKPGTPGKGKNGSNQNPNENNKQTEKDNKRDTKPAGTGNTGNTKNSKSQGQSQDSVSVIPANNSNNSGGGNSDENKDNKDNGKSKDDKPKGKEKD